MASSPDMINNRVEATTWFVHPDNLFANVNQAEPYVIMSVGNGERVRSEVIDMFDNPNRNSVMIHQCPNGETSYAYGLEHNQKSGLPNFPKVTGIKTSGTITEHFHQNCQGFNKKVYF